MAAKINSVSTVVVSLFLLVSGSVGISAQTQTPGQYPRNYFRNPLNIPILLAGNFGECRPNHFHTGLDLKTNGKENERVYAAADGYVSRISISHSGYGNALYIAHPNGYTTVYGHLNDFYSQLQQYVIDQQYAQEQWNIDIILQPGQFPVKKGQFIAFSGNTGGSTGPHLHFEIRNTSTEHVLNAALFGLPVQDNVAPVPRSIAIYGAASMYMQNPVLKPLKKKGTWYEPLTRGLTTNEPFVRIGVLADDYMPGSHNKLGVYQMRLYMDDTLQASWSLHDIDFSLNRYVNAFADYKLKEEGRGWYQTLFRVPGNHWDGYTFLNARNGLLDISDGESHRVHIELTDAAGNTSGIQFSLTCPGAAKTAEGTCTNLWSAGAAQELATSTLFFAVDNQALYDDICFSYTETASPLNYSAVVQLGDGKIPLQTYATLGVKLTRLLPFELRGKLIFAHRIKPAALPGNNPQDAMAARFEKGWAYASVRTFGNYYVTVDTIGPSIEPARKNVNMGSLPQLQFVVKDDKTSVKKFRATLNGNWARFVRAGNTYTYKWDERHIAKGPVELIIQAWDENDNLSSRTFNFSR